MTVLFSSKLSIREMAVVCRQLSTAYGAGLPIISALQLVVDRGASIRARRALLTMAELIRNGATLADAARSQEATFPDLFIVVLAAGEAGGKLGTLLNELADHYEEMAKIARAAKVAMVYPGLQLLCAWYLGTFALNIMKTILDPSRGRIVFADYLSSYASFQMKSHLIALTAIAVFFILRRFGVLDPVISAVKNNVWPINQISRKFSMARFFQCFALLLGAGIEIKQCISRSAALTLNRIMERDLLQAIPLVAQGKTLAEAFVRCKSFTRVDHEMVGVGELSGELEATCKKLSEYHLAEASSALKVGMRVMQVLITLVVGAVIGYIVISFYGRLYGSMLDL